MDTGTLVTPDNMGLGISQVIPVIVATHSLKNRNIYIQQPELHLHPALQCELADDFISSWKENDNTIIAETHSEHLLLRLMKRIRQTSSKSLGEDTHLALTPDDVCILYVDNDGARTFVNEIPLSFDGTLLEPWPNGFFEEGFRERFE